MENAANPTVNAPVEGAINQSADAATQSAVEKGIPAGGSNNSDGPLTAEQLIELKVNGQTRKYTLEQLKSKAALGDAAYEKFEKAAEIEKKQQALRENLKKDFLQTLLDPELGLTKEQIKTRFENWYKENFIDPETMDPRDLKLREYEQKEKERMAREQEQQEQERAQRENEETERERVALQQTIIDTIEKYDLPKTRFTVGRLAYWQRLNLSKGYDAPPDVLVEQVRNEEQAILQNAVKNRMASPEKLVAYLGEDVVKAIRKYDTEQLQKKFGGAPSSNNADGFPRAPEKPRRTMSDVDDYFNELRRSKR